MLNVQKKLADSCSCFLFPMGNYEVCQIMLVLTNMKLHL